MTSVRFALLRHWQIQFVLLGFLSLWALVDPLFEALVMPLLNVPVQPFSAVRNAMEQAGVVRMMMLAAILIAAAATAGSWLMSLVSRSRRKLPQRSLRSILTLTAVVAFWMTLLVNHSAIAWQGKRIRLALQTDHLEAIAGQLRADWPHSDGQLPMLGPFMAYPIGTPETLILLTPPSLEAGNVCISAVQRSDDGSIRFQLGGSGDGDWAEWHPPSGHPVSFVGGLSERYDLQTYARLGEGWYLARYQQ